MNIRKIKACKIPAVDSQLFIDVDFAKRLKAEQIHTRCKITKESCHDIGLTGKPGNPLFTVDGKPCDITGWDTLIDACICLGGTVYHYYPWADIVAQFEKNGCVRINSRDRRYVPSKSNKNGGNKNARKKHG